MYAYVICSLTIATFLSLSIAYCDTNVNITQFGCRLSKSEFLSTTHNQRFRITLIYYNTFIEHFYGQNPSALSHASSERITFRLVRVHSVKSHQIHRRIYVSYGLCIRSQNTIPNRDLLVGWLLNGVSIKFKLSE